MFRIIRKIHDYFTLFEKLLYAFGITTIIVFFAVFDKVNWINLVGSIVGITALLFNAKGNFLGAVFAIIFSVFYGIISYYQSYYGEMITYLGMTTPLCLISLMTWIKHPHESNIFEVKINKVKKKDIVILIISSIIVTIAFYFILKALNTNNLIVSTISILTSFIAVFFSIKRSPLFNLGYLANDVVLIVLWILSTLQDISYINMVACFSVFLILDTYSLFSWLKLEKKQAIEDNLSNNEETLN